jgi:5-methylcytosine-specific restriction endonuclease McrBC GTP-binding regulatory subunit McrB
MGSLEDRLRRLEERLIRQPSVDEYLDASSRQGVRALHALAERLEKYGFDGDYLFVKANRQMLAEDTPEKRGRDRETIEAWRKAQGINPEMETEGAKEKLLAKLEARSGK